MKRIHYLGAVLVVLSVLAVINAQTNVSQPTPVSVSNNVYTYQAPATGSGVAVSQTTVSANTAQLIKSSLGNVYGWSLYNGNSSVCYLQFYNSSSAPTCGTSVVWSFPIPASATSTVVPPYALYQHSTGIGFCAGTTAAGATACSTALSGTLLWK